MHHVTLNYWDAFCVNENDDKMTRTRTTMILMKHSPCSSEVHTPKGKEIRKARFLWQLSSVAFQKPLPILIHFVLWLWKPAWIWSTSVGFLYLWLWTGLSQYKTPAGDERLWVVGNQVFVCHRLAVPPDECHGFYRLSSALSTVFTSGGPFLSCPSCEQ
jgi:hypothetical protein